MNRRAESTRLTELRAKTDRQLVALIDHRLDAGLKVARTSLEAEARKAYTEVRALWPWVHHLTFAERRRLESKLDDLHQLLNQSAVHAAVRLQTACS
ncbi:MAG TPA: hypothetical protein VMH81_26440 [Bryobacteraceae bacterium]|nr:hypothetical protein [Bryobacteraceae bacterium]